MREARDEGAGVKMSARDLGWALRGALVLGAGICASCTTVHATDGRVFTAWDVPSVEAVKASAAFDLRCPPGAIAVENVSTNSTYPNELVADGCGWRATYRVIPRVGRGEYEAVQTSRYSSTLTAARGEATSKSGPGCSKDTDCKGDRVCVQGQCADPAVKAASPSPPKTGAVGP
jgi:hypothetical protein